MADANNKQRLHTVLVPVYNSRETLSLLADRVAKAMDGAQIRFELLLIDDGSRDGSFEEIRRLSRIHPFIRGIRLSRNFGHQAALVIGMQESRGDFLAIIDDDLQDPPEILPDFFSRLYEEADVVYGIRRKRKEGLVKRTLYATFYRILQRLSRVEIPLDAGDFCVMKRRIVDVMLRFQEANPFLRGIRAWVGFRQVGIEYQRAAQLHKSSRYTWRKYFRFAFAGILSFSYIPLHFATYMGIIAALTGFAFAVYVVLAKLIHPFEVSGYASLVVVITFLGGVQLISIGIIGEYLSRLNDNNRRWPVAVVAETTGEEVQ
jgi:glycosyltransferase involved in cell wall biosynthesis